MMPPTRSVALVVVAGTALGLVSRGSDLLPREVGWIGNLGAVWLAVAFAVGAAVGSPKRAAIAGSATLTVAALVHYTSARLLRHGLEIDLFRFPVTQWILIGTAVGSVFGALGAVWSRQHERVWPTAALAASFGAEALYLFARGEPNALALAAPLELVVFLTLPLVVLRHLRARILGVAGSMMMAPFGAGVILGIVAIARRVY